MDISTMTLGQSWDGMGWDGTQPPCPPPSKPGCVQRCCPAPQRAPCEEVSGLIPNGRISSHSAFRGARSPLGGTERCCPATRAHRVMQKQVPHESALVGKCETSLHLPTLCKTIILEVFPSCNCFLGSVGEVDNPRYIAIKSFEFISV